MSLPTTDEQSQARERRQHRRLALRLPVECRREDGSAVCVVRTTTQNVSTGGLYIEVDSPEFRSGDRMKIELTVPASEGVAPYAGRAACEAEVLRVRSIAGREADSVGRHGIAARFLGQLRMSY